MKTKIIFSIFLFFALLVSPELYAQETAKYTNDLRMYYHALELYHNKAYVAAQHSFNTVKTQFDEASEMRANCAYYAANCAVRLGQNNADELMQDFVREYPNSNKRNDAFLEVANYYFNSGKYSYALKWLKQVNANAMSRAAFEDYLFKYAYSLFSAKNYTESKKYFVQLLDSQEYGSRAKYYYGFIAYQQDDFDNADKYLGEVAEDKEYAKEVSYYMAGMNFRLGKFQKAIDEAVPLLPRAKRTDKSEINKIIGESYFNLQQYDKAIPYLKNYKGKRNKLTNTDYYQLGYAHYMQQDYESAISYFNKIIDGKNAVAQNAFYHLAECYLKTGKKSEALNAFRNASQMSFKPQIQEDSFLNYAKLSYDIGNPYKSVPEVLQDFVLAYPNSPEKGSINELIVSAYVVSKDYKGALEYFEKNQNTDKEIYQKVAYLRGVQLFQDGKYQDAKSHFEKSLTQNIDARTTAKANYWKGESDYQLKHYEYALQGYQAFVNDTSATLCEENEIIDYQIGYVYFKQKKYANAISNFEKYINTNPTDKLKKNDAYLRLGDSHFVTSSYNKAISAYTISQDLNPKTADYATFQAGLSYGFIKNKTKKIALLQKVISSYRKSVYRDDALYVLASTQTVMNNINDAISTYNKLLSEYPKSSLVPRTLLKKGLIYYNNNQNDKALQVYKEAVRRYPNTPISQEAVRNARQIYVDTGRVDEYALWVKSLEFVNVTDSELDNDMYEAADRQYSMNEYTKAIKAFKKYLHSFPKGAHGIKANFYLAQSYEATDQTNKTIPYYKYITEQQQNEFTEESLSRLSQLYLNEEKWTKALPLLIQLEEMADRQQNVVFAQSNLMKAYYNKEDYTKAVVYAEKVLSQSGVSDKAISDAQIIIARAAIKTGDQAKARTAYKTVEEMATGELKVEGLYYDAYFKNKDGDYNNSNTVVQTIASEYATYKYWGAKGLVVMAKNFYALNDAYQATYILESVIKNFTQYDDVVAEAQTELNIIKKEEAKTNDSVIPE